MVLTKSLAVALWALLGLVLLSIPCDASARGPSHVLKRPATRGQRKKGWRRRAQDWESAKETPREGVTSTIVTNPSTLGKGKGGDGTVTYSSEDEDGRTTFVIKCRDHKAMAVEKTTVAGDKVGIAGKGGKAGEKSSLETKSSLASTKTVKASTKTIPDDICDEVDEDGSGSGGGWVDGVDGGAGDGSGSGGAGSGGAGNGGGTGDDDYPPGSGQLSGSLGAGGLASCDQVAAGTGPTTGSAIQYDVSLDVIKESDLPSVGIMRLMKADLQFNVAPEIADCIVVGGNSGSGSGGTTNITNVVFQDLIGDESGCSTEYVNEAATLGGTCLNTIIPVIVYYEGSDTAGFLTRVQDAIDNHQWNVPGLMDTSDVDRGSGNGVSGFAGQAVEENNTIGSAGYLTIAAASLVLLLLALMMVRRRRRDERVKHISLEDDDDTYLRDLEGESHASSPNRLARVVGEDDSVNTGWTGGGTFRNFDGAMDGNFSGMETRPSHQDVHICSSATCEVCERNRQAGVQFIPSGTNMAHPPLPPDSPREYPSEDTVNL